jgi:hypothetical protein
LNYAIARCYALQKNADKALFWLKASIALGYRNLQDARADQAFAMLRERTEYRDLLGLRGWPRHRLGDHQGAGAAVMSNIHRVWELPLNSAARSYEDFDQFLRAVAMG